jgi:hypothetical protein
MSTTIEKATTVMNAALDDLLGGIKAKTATMQTRDDILDLLRIPENTLLISLALKTRSVEVK